jgi:hypothetical protein
VVELEAKHGIGQRCERVQRRFAASYKSRYKGNEMGELLLPSHAVLSMAGFPRQPATNMRAFGKTTRHLVKNAPIAAHWRSMAQPGGVTI